MPGINERRLKFLSSGQHGTAKCLLPNTSEFVGTT